MSEEHNSEKFYRKLIGIFNIKLLKEGFIFSKIWWLIDAKYRRKSRLDAHILHQILAPGKLTLELAVKLHKSTRDATACNIRNWVIKNIKYKSEAEELWKTAEHTIYDGYGDCDDMNNIVVILCRLSGITQYQIYSAIGSMPNGGHFWPMYFSTKIEKMVSLDTCYYANTGTIKSLKPFNELSYHKSIWYMFNDEVTIKAIN